MVFCAIINTIKIVVRASSLCALICDLSGIFIHVIIWHGLYVKMCANAVLSFIIMAQQWHGVLHTQPHHASLCVAIHDSWMRGVIL